jgi:methionine salvage enolase-phosphatase E1
MLRIIMSGMIELYDMGRTTHRAVPGMYEFIESSAEKYVGDYRLAHELKNQAKLREVEGHSVPQEYFSLMCGIWTKAYRDGDFKIDIDSVIFPDTVPRFQKVKAAGKNIGILTSASKEFTDILYSLPLDGGKLSDYIDEYFLGEQIGDKDFPETFAGLWDYTGGKISAVFDDKPSVCRAAADGLKMAGGSARIYMLDRKGQLPECAADELESAGVKIIRNFGEAE